MFDITIQMFGHSDGLWCTPIFFKDSNVSPKMKIIEKKVIDIFSLAFRTSGVEGHVGTAWWGLGKVTSRPIIHMDLHKPNNQLVSASWNIFGAWTSHRHTRTHKTHHNPDLGEAINFPLMVFFVIGHGDCTQMSFYLGTPKLRVPKFSKLGLSPLWKPITSRVDLWLKWVRFKIKL